MKPLLIKLYFMIHAKYYIFFKLLFDYHVGLHLHDIT